MFKKLYRKYIKFLDKRSRVVRLQKQKIGEYIEIHKMIKAKPVNGIKLSMEQEEAVQTFWKEKYGKKIFLLWHRKYYGYSGKFDARCIPEIFYTTKIEPALNPEMAAKSLSDKNLIEFIYAKVLMSSRDIVVPKTEGGCANGYYFDSSRNPISEEGLVNQLKNIEGQFIIKPSVGESSGHGVRKLELKEGIDLIENSEIEDVIDYYGNDFIIQDCISQNEIFAALHPESINTIRLMTYRAQDEIKVAPAAMRIGVGKSHLDNGHAGGIYVGVTEEGYLLERAVKNYGDIYKAHPDTGIVFHNYHLPCFEKILNAAIELHKCVPSIGIINWDLALNDKNQIVLIESNMMCGSVWLFENTWGCSPFGEDTEYMISKM